MATFEIIEGNVGQGKSLYTAKLVRKLLERNKKWYERSGIVRHVYSNLKFADHFEKSYHQFLRYWKNTDEICVLRDVDVIWDEIATELDARNFANLSDELKRFLSQYRKRGIDIYANTQDFSMIDARARLMITRVATLSKLIGSPDPSPTKPPVKRIWGITMVRDVINYKEDKPEFKKYGMPSFFFIDREDVEIYDTRQDISSGTLPVRKLRKEVGVYEVNGQVEYKRVRYI